MEKKEIKTKIYKIKESDSLSEYELEYIEKLGAEWLVYYYEYGNYDGSGFAVWKVGKKLYYHDMGHCSCYGPTDEMENRMPVDDIESIEKLAKNYNFGSEVVKFIRDKKL